MKISWGEPPTYFFMGKIKVGHPTYLFAAKIEVVKTFMASNLLFVLENRSWGYKNQFQANSKELWSQAIPRNTFKVAQSSFCRCAKGPQARARAPKKHAGT